MTDKSAFPPDVATQLAVAKHHGHSIRGDDPREDAAVSALYVSKVQPGSTSSSAPIVPGMSPIRTGPASARSPRPAYGV
jgi:hypothetical protein